MSVERVDALLHRLAERDLVILEGERIVGAYPLTDRPTEHRVSVEGQRLHAMCAIDALGVGAMYGTSTVIESRCRLCRAAIDIRTVDHGRRLEAVLPAEAVVFASIGYRGGCAAASLCTTIAFFCSGGHLDQWQSAQELEGTGFRLSIDEALQVGRAIFGPVFALPALEQRRQHGCEHHDLVHPRSLIERAAQPAGCLIGVQGASPSCAGLPCDSFSVGWSVGEDAVGSDALDKAYVAFFGAFGDAWDDAMVACWSADPFGMLWPEMNAAFVTSVAEMAAISRRSAIGRDHRRGVESGRTRPDSLRWDGFLLVGGVFELQDRSGIPTDRLHARIG